MSERYVLLGATVFDGAEWRDRSGLVVSDGLVEGIVAADSPIDAERRWLSGGLLVPGFIDLQVNGGGGALLNADPSLESIRTICTAFGQFGTTAALPTLVTDTPEVMERAIEAGRAARAADLPGFLGFHFEGPHLSVARKGAHDPKLIRPMDDADFDRLLRAKQAVGTLLVTVAAETVPPDRIAALVQAGIVVSIGHSEGTYAQVSAAAAAGATMVTHLFNAQSQLGNREPGVVGSALDLGALHAGLIADGIHVHPAAIGTAVRAKQGPGQIFLVTDAMSPTGTDAESFELTGRTVYRRDGALRLADGTLAGADLTMIAALRYMHETIGLPLEEAIRMASLYPAEAIGAGATHGHLGKGARADMVVLSETLEVEATYIGGAEVYRRTG